MWLSKWVWWTHGVHRLHTDKNRDDTYLTFNQINHPRFRPNDFLNWMSLLPDFNRPLLRRKGGEILVVLIYFVFQMCIEQFLLLAGSLPDFVNQAGLPGYAVRRGVDSDEVRIGRRGGWFNNIKIYHPDPCKPVHPALEEKAGKFLQFSSFWITIGITPGEWLI